MNKNCLHILIVALNKVSFNQCLISGSGFKSYSDPVFLPKMQIQIQMDSWRHIDEDKSRIRIQIRIQVLTSRPDLPSCYFSKSRVLSLLIPGQIKAFLYAEFEVLFILFCQFHCHWIQIRRLESQTNADTHCSGSG